MATVTTNFGTNTALTVTNLHSLGNAAYWQSAAIDNGTVLGLWAELFVTIVTTTTAGSDGSVKVYLAGSTDGGTDYAGGASGTEGSYTVIGNSDEQLQYITSIPIDASEIIARTYKKRIVIHDLPEDFAILIKNDTGTGLAASGNLVEYRLNKYDSA